MPEWIFIEGCEKIGGTRSPGARSESDANAVDPRTPRIRGVFEGNFREGVQNAHSKCKVTITSKGCKSFLEKLQDFVDVAFDFHF